ncbi:MAG: hypothetical protein PW735_07430 [Acidobacteriaceae bacterium]|nr:hypothetical protein [Acidobacteriaceae bacterium]
MHRRLAPSSLLRTAWIASAFVFALPAVWAQSPTANTTAKAPAGVAAESKTVTPPPVSEHDALEADNAYLQGARQISKSDYAGAEANFRRAVQLNPQNPDYARATLYAREAQVTTLLHQATTARVKGDHALEKDLLQQAHKLDPDNRIVAEHLSSGAESNSPAIDPLQFPPEDIAATLGSAPHLEPLPGPSSFHERGAPEDVLKAVYRAYGIDVQFDAPLTATKPIRFDLDGANYDTVTSLLSDMTGTFTAPVQAHQAIIANNTQDNRDRLIPQVEETIYLRGMTSDQMQEYANIARNIFDVKTVTASATGGTILIRADEPTLKLLNAAYSDMLDGGSDIMLDINLYEVDTSKQRNYGVEFPSEMQSFSLYSELNSVITANQSSINTAISNGIITLGSNTEQNMLIELEFLYGAGLLSSSEQSLITGLLGTIGNYAGIPLIGTSISSGATVNALLTSSDVRIVDSVKIRASSLQQVQFRSGTRYPIVTSTYSSGVSSSTASLAALYGYSTTSVTIPQIQFEDLGLTMKLTPKVQRNRDISIAFEMKIEALGSTSLNDIPELNNRQLNSTTTVPDGQTALIVSSVNKSEAGTIIGTPGLNDLPGFSGTDKSTDNSTNELLISITPHIVREQNLHFVSRMLATPHSQPSSH